MKLDNAVVFITGANRGIGFAFAREALARGARKVYAGVRNPASVTLAGVEPIQLDVTLLINNAGIATFGGFLGEGGVESARTQLETNFFGPLNLSKAFAPVLAANGGGAILNVLSIASWISRPQLGTYGASKSAAWGLTNSLRHELRSQNTKVIGMHVGFVDTDLTRAMGNDVPKSAPEAVVRYVFDAVEAGAEEVLADQRTRDVKRGLSAEPGVYLVPA
jgi:NAD(P)-dependent dehydrogenase (short-subunit alcohol dehydrogenase family)